MISGADALTPLGPPTADVDISLGDWFQPRGTGPLEEFITTELWGRPDRPRGWEAARLSSAAFIFRESRTHWSLVAKFYAEKTGARAEGDARRELGYNQRARELGLSGDDLSAVRPLALWRGVLLLEHVPGLTLEDIVAIRRSHPGTLIPALDLVVKFLARLHTVSEETEQSPALDRAITDAHKYVQNLARHGVLKRKTQLRSTISDAIDLWAKRLEVLSFVPCLIHGDATTTNFVFPPQGGIVAIDWERAKISDPAADLGRLMAECAHCILDHGGDSEQAERVISILGSRYHAYRDLGDEPGALHERARFHRAVSTLRIARNGWLPREYRLSLVGQAQQLLAALP